MKKTIFNTPIISAFLRGFAKVILRLIGWRVVGQLPEVPKSVIVGAPHTSNWDFMMFLALGLILKGSFYYMGKMELFRWPFGGFFRWCGGVPVNRAQPQGLVDQVTKTIREADQFHLVITPEGTRRRVKEWKTGFHHIARNADIPVVVGFVDSGKKETGLGPSFIMTDDIESDIKNLKEFFKDKVGINPQLMSEL